MHFRRHDACSGGTSVRLGPRPAHPEQGAGVPPHERTRRPEAKVAGIGRDGTERRTAQHRPSDALGNAWREGHTTHTAQSGSIRMERTNVMEAIRVLEYLSSPTSMQVPEVLKVASNSHVTSVAGAIAGVIRSSGRVELQAIGAGAVNQATKAVAIARKYLAQDGIDVVSIPAFATVSIADKERTAVRIIVEPR